MAHHTLMTIGKTPNQTVTRGTSMSSGVPMNAEKYDRATEPYIHRISSDRPSAPLPNVGFLLGLEKSWKCPLAQRDRCWKQLRISSGASPSARYSSTYRHCQLRRLSSMPSAKSSVSVHSGNHPACWNALARSKKLVPVHDIRPKAS